MTEENKGKNRRNPCNRTQSYKHVEVNLQDARVTKSFNATQKSGGFIKNESGKAISGKKNRLSVQADSKARLNIIPLGGLDAIGKNMTAFECKGDILLDDAGLMFPDDNHPGVDLILPDYTYILENAHKLRGIVITHGHEDHTGSLPYLLKDLDVDVPIYATKLTLGIIEGKLKEHGIKNTKLVEVKPGQQIKLGCMVVDVFSVNHSIPDAVGLFIQTPAGNVLHTGDFKLDQTPVDGVCTDFAALTRFSAQGVDLMLSDSTNSMNNEFTPSEVEVGKTLKSIISQAPGRVIVASFASHIHRVQQICDAAVEDGRKVAVTGRSMIQNTDTARRLGYLRVPDNYIVDAFDIDNIAPEQLVIMCTGSQGEPLSALGRIAKGEHRSIVLGKGDTVIISATPVPGNEKAVTRVVNSLSKLGVDVYDKKRAMVHVSGHASAEELKIMLRLVRPRHFMPVHGESMHLMTHANLAKATGVNPDKIFICENGQSLVMQNGRVSRGEDFQNGIIYVDGLSVGDTSQDVLDQRALLGTQGFASVAAIVSLKNASLVGSVQLTMRGITGGDDEYLVRDIEKSFASSLGRALQKGYDIFELKKSCRSSLLSLIYDRTKQRPDVVIHLMEQ